MLLALALVVGAQFPVDRPGVVGFRATIVQVETVKTSVSGDILRAEGVRGHFATGNGVFHKSWLLEGRDHATIRVVFVDGVLTPSEPLQEVP